MIIESCFLPHFYCTSCTFMANSIFCADKPDKWNEIMNSVIDRSMFALSYWKMTISSREVVE